MIERLTKAALSLILVLVLTASVASIASAGHLDTEASVKVEGKIGAKDEPVDPPDPTPTPTLSPSPTPNPSASPKPTVPPGGGGGGGGSTSPKTGDDASIGLYVAMGLTALFMLILLWKKRGARHEGNEMLQGS